MAQLVEQVAEKIQHLSPAQLAEVDKFIDGLECSVGEAHKTGEWLALSSSALDRIWSNPEDSIYDDL